MKEPTFHDFVQITIEADDIIRQLKRDPKFQMKKPSGLRAALVWLLAHKKGYLITQRNLMWIYGVTETIILQNAKLLSKYVEDEGEKR